jgi:hypothetical protein
MNLPPIPPPPPLPPLEVLADQLAECQAQLKAWGGRRDALIMQFEALHQSGAAPEKFQHSGRSYSRVPSTTYDYSACPDVIQAQETLKNLQEQAKAAGTATLKPTKPTWKITSPRERTNES